MRLGDLAPAVVAVILIGMVLGIGIFVMSEVRTEVATNHTGSDVSVNVTLTAANTTTLTDASKDDYYLWSVNVTNSSNGAQIPSDNYTFTSAGVITWSNDIHAGNTVLPPYALVNVSSVFTYDLADSPEEGIGDAMDGLVDLSGWIAVIVVVLAAAIVLGIVLRSFGGRRVSA